MIYRLILSLVFLTSPLIAQSQVKAYPVDAWHSYIGFSVKFGGLLPVKGSFSQFSGTVLLNERDLSSTSATVMVKAESINTGVAIRDRHLKSEDFFEVGTFPKFRFSSKSVRRQNDQWLMTGELSMHGITKEVEVPFEYLHTEAPDPWKNARITLQGEFTINRLDFGIGEGQKGIAKEVNISLIISASVFNTTSISLFKRPFGEQMVAAFEEGGIEKATGQLKSLRAAADKDAAKPNSFEFLYLYFDQSKKPELAKEAAKLYATVFPEDANAHSVLGYVYYQHGEKSKALSAFNKALSLDAEESLALEMKKLLGSNE